MSMKTLLITGCSSGFGRATASLFLEQGWNVVATMRTPEKADLAPSPRLRVLRMDGSYLDSDSMKEIKAFAKKRNVQLWVEVVSDDPKAGFFIVDGEVANEK